MNKELELLNTIALLMQGARQEAIESELDLSPEKVNSILSEIKQSQRLTISNHKGLLRLRLKSEVEKETTTSMIKGLFNSGKTPAQISELIGKPRKTVHEILSRMGRKGEINHLYKTPSMAVAKELIDNGAYDVDTIIQQTGVCNRHALSMLLIRMKKAGMIDQSIRIGKTILVYSETKKDPNIGCYTKTIHELVAQGKSRKEISQEVNRPENYVAAIISYAKKRSL